MRRQHIELSRIACAILLTLFWAVAVNTAHAAGNAASLGVHFNNSGVSTGGAEVSCGNWYDVSAAPSGINYWGPYTDDQGNGSVTVNWAKAGQSSVYNSGDGAKTARVPLLRGEAKMHYYGQEWGMTGISYGMYDVYLYGVFNSGNSFTIDVSCDNGLTQSVTTGGGDPGPPAYAQGTNYLVWRGVTSSSFHLTGSEIDLCAIQIVETRPSINNANGATNVSSTNAWLNGTLVSRGATGCIVRVYWGTNDGQTVYSAWSATNLISTNMNSGTSFTTNTMNLLPGTLYFYRCYATNWMRQEAWASSTETFLTGPAGGNGNVWIMATDAQARERDLDPGTFTIYRPNTAFTTNGPLRIYYTITGNASNGVDYVTISTSVVMATAMYATNITITPIADNLTTEGSETVTVTLATGPYVILAATNTANVVIEDAFPDMAVLGVNYAEIITNEAASVAKGTDFGGMATNESHVHTFTITNLLTGTYWLSLTNVPSVQITGHTNAFQVTTQPSSTNIAPSNTVTFQITFHPDTTGVRTGLVTIVNNDPDENPYRFSLTGIGAPRVFTNWLYKMKITFTGYDYAGVQTNFPALAAITNNMDNSGFDYAQMANTNGGDLRFADATETVELNYEVEEWNTSGRSYVWTQVPIFTNNCYIWAYWGRQGVTAPAYTTNGATWSNGFEMVWHMRATNTASQVPDSTAYGRNGANTGTTNISGVVSDGRGFDGSSTYLSATGYKGVLGTTNRTISAWVRLDGTNDNGALILWGTNSTGRRWRIWVNSAFGNGQQGAYRSDFGSMGVTGTNDCRDSTWHYVANVMWGTNVGTDVGFYMDGVSNAPTLASASGMLDTLPQNDVTVGYSSLNSLWLRGFIDEVRIDNVNRSSNWIWTCWLNMASNDLTVSASPYIGPPWLTNNAATTITTNSAYMNGNLAATGQAPAYVWVYWGTFDGQNTNNAWGNTNYLGMRTAGALSTNMGALIPNTTYWYRFYATNVYGSNWATPSVSFSTLPLGGPVAVDNANGATGINGSNGTAYACGYLSGTGGSPTTVWIYWGDNDGGTNKNSWDTAVNMGVRVVGGFSNQVSGLSADKAYYYRCYASNVANAQAWASNSSVWMAQTRTRGGWHLVSVPMDFGSGSNRLNSVLGTNLMTAAQSGAADSTSDNIWYQAPGGTTWWRNWYAASGWQTSSAQSTLEIKVGEAFWVKRYTNGVAVDYTRLAGTKPTNSATITLLSSNWVTFGWPYSPVATTDGAGTTNVGWGFAARGCVRGWNQDSADQIMIRTTNKSYCIYLGFDSNWYKAGTRQLTDQCLEPGRGYYYYHRGSTAKTWQAPGY